MKARLIHIKWSFTLLCAAIAMGVATTTAFVPFRQTGNRRHAFVLEQLPSISEMTLTDMKEELASYGVSTKGFLEKKDFIAAVTQARSQGKTPRTSSASSSSDSSMPSGQSGRTRSERIQDETEKAKSMSVSDLKKELTIRGIKTNSFFEKSEFVRAYAEAIVDGVEAMGSDSNSSTSGERGQRQQQRTKETFDPAYRDVQVRKLDQNARTMIQGNVIDV